MKRIFQHLLACALPLILSIIASGCAQTEKKPTVPDSAIGAYKATDEQTFIAGARAAASFERVDDSQKKTLKKMGVRHLAVRTLDPDPSQLAAIQQKVKASPSLYGEGATGGPFYCVMIWDTETQKLVSTECYAGIKAPERHSIARFGTFVAQYVGSF